MTTEEQAQLDQFFAEHGKDVRSKDREGKALLHKAAQLGKLEVVKFLVSKGADIDAKSEHGLTPLFYAKANQHLAIAEYLKSVGGSFKESITIGKNGQVNNVEGNTVPEVVGGAMIGGGVGWAISAVVASKALVAATPAALLVAAGIGVFSVAKVVSTKRRLKREMQEKDRLLKELIAKQQAVNVAIKQDRDLTEEKANDLNSKNIALQQAIQDLKAELGQTP